MDIFKVGRRGLVPLIVGLTVTLFRMISRYVFIELGELRAGYPKNVCFLFVFDRSRRIFLIFFVSLRGLKLLITVLNVERLLMFLGYVVIFLRRSTNQGYLKRRIW